jgi:hypothetical protein
LNGEIDILKKNIEQLNKEKIDDMLKLESKDELIKQIQKNFDLFSNKFHTIEQEKEKFYETVVESHSKIEQLKKHI